MRKSGPHESLIQTLLVSTAHSTVQFNVVQPQLTAHAHHTVENRDGRILIFSRIPDSDTRHLISGRSRSWIRIFDVTTVSLYLQQNTGNRLQLLFSVIRNVTHVT